MFLLKLRLLLVWHEVWLWVAVLCDGREGLGGRRGVPTAGRGWVPVGLGWVGVAKVGRGVGWKGGVSWV